MRHRLERVAWRTLAFFYADRGGERSGETDYGVWWHDLADPSEAWRVSWVRDTGDVYAVAMNSGRVLLLAEKLAGDDVERRLTGWAERCGQPGSMLWVMEQLA